MSVVLANTTTAQYHQMASGLWVPTQVKRRPRALDLFCGAGGFSLGMIQAGWEVVGGCDNDPDCAITYMMNLGSYPIDIHYIEDGDKDRLNEAVEKFIKHASHSRKINVLHTSGSGWISHHPDLPPVRHFWFGDIRKLKGDDVLRVLGMKQGELDCVVGGPPCQGFSTMGKRQVMDPRNSLVFEFARLVVELQPKTMIFENVPGILSMVTPEGLPVVDAFCRVLEDGGFGVYETLKRSLLASSGCGAALRSKSRTRKQDAEDAASEEDEGSEGPQQLELFA